MPTPRRASAPTAAGPDSGPWDSCGTSATSVSWRARRWLTNAQIAVSTGTSGNSSVPNNYVHLALVSGGLDYYGNAGMAPSQPASEDLGWEKLWTTNLAFHLGFWNRLNVDLELYNKRTTDMLMQVPQSYAYKGYGYYWDNIGVMVNRGAEINLSGTVVATKGFMWSLNANVSYNKNKIVELYNGVQEYEMAATSMKLVVGHDSGEFYVNRFAGVNPANGDALWYTKDGEITTEMRDEDKVLVGKSMNAPWAGGFGTTLAWKGISLSAQFSWVADRWMMNNDRYFDESNGRFSTYNQSRRLLDRWKQPGDNTDIPRHGVYTEFDDRLLEDASFLRLKNLMISYTFPEELIRKTRFISGLKIYAQAQNLLTFTKFSGLDPEGVGNMYQAQALHARVALYMQDFDTAIKYASKVIDNKAGIELTDVSVISGSTTYLAYMWAYDWGTEIIWLIGYTSTSYGGALGQVFLNINRDYQHYYPDYVPAQWVLDAYATDYDLRYSTYFQEVTTGYANGLTWPVLVKYFGNQELIAAAKLYMYCMPKLFRLAEQYLIRAEVYCRLDTPNFAAASKDLSELRANRYSGSTGSLSVSANNWLENISQERVRELYMEGFRLNDLKRWHMGFERKPQTNTLPEGNSLKIEADDPRFVWPIPRHELEAPGAEIEPNESNN